MQIRSPLHAARLAARFVFLQRSQWWPLERLQRHQLNQLRNLVSVAGQTAFYRRLMERNGFNPSAHLRSINDLERLPLLDKQTLLAAPIGERLNPGSDPAKLVHRLTSGSTAEPFAVYLSQYEKDARVLLELRMLRALGNGVRSKMLEMRRLSDLSAGSGANSFLGLFPRRGVDFLRSSEEKLEALEASHCEVFKAHTSSLVTLSEALGHRSLQLPYLRCILSSAEYLDTPARQLIQQAFGVPVYDQYGTVEFGFMAWECPQQDGLHVSAEDFIVELVDDSGNAASPGSSGEVVVTALRQTTMPLIRYRTGDRAQWIPEACTCGRTLPRLRIMRGRTLDYVARADGTDVNPHFFTILWEGIDGIRQFQVVQESLTQLTYRYVLQPGSDATTVEHSLRQRIEEEFGPQTSVNFERVEQIAAEVSGKLKYLHSRIGRHGTVTPE